MKIIIDNKINCIEVFLIKLFLIFTLLNYQVVTICMNDIFVFKYLRDILILILLFLVLSTGKIKKNNIFLFLIVFVCILFWGAIITQNTSAILVFLRRYMLPLTMLFILTNIELTSNDIYRLIKFWINLLVVLAIWGIFQAYILGPDFLIQLGYPTKYSYAYKATTLKDSFYFGNLGIQRVVSTVSNSNVFAVVLGVTILTYIAFYDKLCKNRKEFIKLIFIMMAYVLTFSRANFLAFALILICGFWKKIPYKKYLILLSIFVLSIIIVYCNLASGDNIILKLYGWVIDSLSLKESSASGRLGIWKEAFDAAITKPYGYGFGNVGSWAQSNMVSSFYHCENSYLAIAIDLGILGTIAYVIFSLSLVKNIKHLKNNYMNLNKGAVSIISYVAICCFFSNHIYDLEVMVSYYFIFALFYRKLLLTRK